MASPSRPPSAVDPWTETDQEIIETLLMVDGSARHPASTNPPIPAAHTPAARPSMPMLVGPTLSPHVSTATATVAYAMPSNVAVVPVAYWVPTPTTYYAPPGGYHAAPPTYFTHAGVPPPHSSVDMDLQEILSEEERKAKHRDVQRRFVQRKKEQMDRVRREATSLEKRASYLRLSMEQLSLEKENVELQDQIDDTDEIQIPTADEINLVLEEECIAAQNAFEPITDAAFTELFSETMARVTDTVIKESRKLDDRTKVQLLGWTGRRVLETGGGADDTAAMRFEIVKQFPRVTPHETASRAWKEIRDVSGLHRFFHPSLLIKIVKLQHVNDDAVVVFKTILNPHTAAIHHSVDLWCRIEMADEVLIIARDLHVPSVRACVRDPHGWSHSLTVLGFGAAAPPAQLQGQTAAAVPTQRGDGTSFRYNCCIQDTSEANLRYWLVESLFVVVRFESLLIAPLFTLAAPKPAAAR